MAMFSMISGIASALCDQKVAYAGGSRVVARSPRTPRVRPSNRDEGCIDAVTAVAFATAVLSSDDGGGSSSGGGESGGWE